MLMRFAHITFSVLEHIRAASKFRMLQAPLHRTVDSSMLDLLARLQRVLEAPPAPPARRVQRAARVVDAATQTETPISVIDRLRVLLAWAYVASAILLLFIFLVEFLVIQLKPCWSSHPFFKLFVLSYFELICICYCIVAIHVRKHKRSTSPPRAVHRLPLYYPDIFILAFSTHLVLSLIFTLCPDTIQNMWANCTNRNLTSTAHLNLSASLQANFNKTLPSSFEFNASNTNIFSDSSTTASLFDSLADPIFTLCLDTCLRHSTHIH